MTSYISAQLFKSFKRGNFKNVKSWDCLYFQLTKLGIRIFPLNFSSILHNSIDLVKTRAGSGVGQSFLYLLSTFHCIEHLWLLNNHCQVNHNGKYFFTLTFSQATKPRLFCCPTLKIVFVLGWFGWLKLKVCIIFVANFSVNKMENMTNFKPCLHNKEVHLSISAVKMLCFLLQSTGEMIWTLRCCFIDNAKCRGRV